MMKPMMMLILPSVLVLGSGALATGTPTGDLLGAGRADQLVRVERVRFDDGRLSGRLVNASDKQLREVRLLVRQSFQWRDEFHPGADNPGRATVIALDQTLAPGASLDFTESLAPLPPRVDGSFTTDIEVVGFTQVGAGEPGPLTAGPRLVP